MKPGSSLVTRLSAGRAPPLSRRPGHHAEWIKACKGEGKTFSPFEVGGPLTELCLIGNIAVPTGRPLEYDPVEGKIKGSAEAEALLHRPYRAGWSL